MSAAASPVSPVPVPDELSQVPAGAVLAGVLEDIEIERVSGYDTVEVLCAEYRLWCRQSARLYRAVLETGMRRPFSIDTVERTSTLGEFAAEEARAALVWSRSRAEATIGFAFELFVRLPVLGEAMLAGQLDEPRARALITWTDGLDTERALAVCQQLLPTAGTVTVGELIERVKRACLAIDAEWAEKKYRQAVRARRVRGFLGPDGTGTLTGQSQPAERVIAACERIDALARACKRAGDGRAIDHIRSDLFLGMTDGTLEGLTEPEIIAHVLAHPYTVPGDHDGHDSDGEHPGGEGPGGTGSGNNGPGSGGADGPGSGGTHGPGGGGTHGPSAGGANRGGPYEDRGSDGDGPGEPGDRGPDSPGDAGGGTGGLGRGGLGPGGGAAFPLPRPPELGAPLEPLEPAALAEPAGPGVPTGPPGPAERSEDTEPAASAEPAAPTRVWAVPELRVQLGTLLGLNGEPGEVPGWGYVPGWLARHLVARMGGAQWRYAICDTNGQVIDGGLITTRPLLLDRARVRRDAAAAASSKSRCAPANPPS
jgi:hypothetical protein